MIIVYRDGADHEAAVDEAVVVAKGGEVCAEHGLIVLDIEAGGAVRGRMKARAFRQPARTLALKRLISFLVDIHN